MNASELCKELPTYTDQFVRNVGVDNTKVTTKEFAKTRGQINYAAVVDVNYHYQSFENE